MSLDLLRRRPDISQAERELASTTAEIGMATADQNAVKEVDTTWDDYAAQQDRLARLGEALVASQRAVTLANERYSDCRDVPSGVRARRRRPARPGAEIAMKQGGLSWCSRVLSVLALAVAFMLTACATTPVPVASASASASTPLPPSGNSRLSGSLVVYSATYASTVEQSEYPVHTNYTVATSGDMLIERVTNRTGPFYAYPATVTLPAGKYHIRAQYDRGGFVVIPVDIEPGKITIVDLDHEALPAEDIPTREPIRLPGGRVVGWRAML